MLGTEQKRALHGIAKAYSKWDKSCHRNVILSGYAGTGKTYLIAKIYEELGVDGNVLIAAPTHKAARVIGEKLGGNVPVHTAHSLFYIRPNDMIQSIVGAINNAEDAKIRSELEEALYALQHSNVETLTFMPRTLWDEDASIVIIDEASMLSEDMVNIIRALDIFVIYVGDGGQLPPVRAKAGINLACADFTLTKIHRNAKDSPIPWIADKVRKSPSRYIPSILTEAQALYPEVFVGTPLGNGMNITWTNADRQLINRGYRDNAHVLTQGMEYIIHKGGNGLVIGDTIKVSKIINSKYRGNPYLKEAFIMVEGKKRLVVLSTIDIDPKADSKSECLYKAKAEQYPVVALPYAITCHKSQGSEYPGVNIFPSSLFSGRMGDADVRKWVYTAITRAKERVFIAL